MGRLLVGLTGGLASGKSTVGRLLAAAGCTVIDADRLVAELYAAGQPGAAAVRELFGDRALAADGSVDREAVARRVFADPQARRRLEAAIHPLAAERFRQRATGLDGIVVLEATLLVEAGWAEVFDRVVTVEAAPAVRLERAMARGMSRAEAERRLAAQGPGDARREGADVLLHNDGGLDELRQAVARLVHDLRARLATGPASPRL
ncbi:MAG TPA: dephospho-CoA kinase [Thermoanaerobaculia bacterium]|nr:dephospho-CoA kinase [Thermoanaerobaculia bacterium]